MTDVRRRRFLVSIARWMTGLFVRQSIPKVLTTKLGLCQAAELSPLPPRRSSDAQTQPDGRTLADHPSMARSYWFTDVASRSQFAYRTNNNFRRRKYFPQFHDPIYGGMLKPLHNAAWPVRFTDKML
jgi:hypothetical protein